MPALNYRFIPQYGFEPYDVASGETEVTQNNLVITSWFASLQQGPASPLAFFDQLIPNYANTSVGAAERAASLSSINSRVSAKFFFSVSSNVVGGICCVVNPPAEYKQQMQGAIVYNGGDPFDIASYTVKKPLQGNYLWEASKDLAGSSSQNILQSSVVDLAYGTVPPNTSALLSGAPLQLLKTNGADGTAPTFFDFSSPVGVNAMIAALNAGGEYYVPLFYTLGSSSPDPAYRNLKYPHSAARG